MEVGYDEDEIYAEVLPASDNEVSIEERQVEELTSLVYTEAHLLDTFVGEFAHAIYDYLYGATNHKGFQYTKFSAYDKARLAWEHAKANEKEYGTKTFEKFLPSGLWFGTNGFRLVLV